MTLQEPMSGQIVFATHAGGGITLDCILGEPGQPGLPMTFTARRIERSKLGLTVLGLLERWARESTTVEVRLGIDGRRPRVHISAGGTRVVLEPAETPA